MLIFRVFAGESFAPAACETAGACCTTPYWEPT
jgi:hypothetical protein